MASSGAAKNPKKTNLLDHHSIKHLLDESVTDVEIPTHFSLSYFVLSNFSFAKISRSLGFLRWNRFFFFLDSGRQESGVRGGLEVEQREVADRVHHHRHRAPCAVLPEEVSREQGFPYCLHRIISLFPFLLFEVAVFVIFFGFPLKKLKLLVGSFDEIVLSLTWASMWYLTGCCSSSATRRRRTLSFLLILRLFTKDGVLVEGLFWKDVEKLIDDYNGDRKSK
ncbi:hypothetical protein B296_00029894 [Ensete ventricosum]|uniref:Signal peptidase complex subunit 2 n=1 Tax=Ensete ventricosum TaxID=4639 RepID=A0A426ZCF8_ENSVE|nr:hypothetical protein B296_00029894 [Ensete ventricosum]